MSPSAVPAPTTHACTAGSRVRARAGHAVDVIDPIELSLPLLRKPQFAYAEGQAPPALDALAATLRAADAYIMVTPE